MKNSQIFIERQRTDDAEYVFWVKSKSHPDKEYLVTKKNEEWECNCTAGMMKRLCSHVKKKMKEITVTKKYQIIDRVLHESYEVYDNIENEMLKCINGNEYYGDEAETMMGNIGKDNQSNDQTVIAETIHYNTYQDYLDDAWFWME